MFPQEWVWLESPRIGQSRKSRGPGAEPQYFTVGQEDKPTQETREEEQQREARRVQGCGSLEESLSGKGEQLCPV